MRRGVRDYTALQQYWRCARAYGFHLLGWQPVAQPEAVVAGILAHTHISHHLKGGTDTGAIDAQRDEHLARLVRIQDDQKRLKLEKGIWASYKRGLELANRYIAFRLPGYEPPFEVEMELELEGVIAHPDLLTKLGGRQVVVDFKTSRFPDLRWYSCSGQCDLYAYILGRGYQRDVALIAYDVISEDGIFSVKAQPNLARGGYLFGKINALDNSPFNNFASPQYSWGCPKCEFFEPCWLYDADSPTACFEYLHQFYIKEVGQ